MNNSEILQSISFELTFNNTQLAAIIIMDEHGIILASNTGVYKSYGYSPEDLIGKHISVLFIEEDRLKNLPEIELTQVRQKHASSDLNYVVNKEGVPIWSHGETVFTQNNEGKILFVKLIYDINSQKLQENRLMRANEELRRLNVELDNFVYSASHDLKAPIANIEALIHTLEDEMNEESKKNTSEILGMLKISIDKFKNTIGDLTTTGRAMITGKRDNEINFEELIQTIKLDLQEEIKRSKTIFKENFEKAQNIRMSKKDLRSILFNLISNAIKYRCPDRIPEVRVNTYKSNGYVAIEVADNGLGIKESDREKIFEIYTRLHTHVEGTGVGMNIVKKIVDAYHGKIEVESEYKKGSSFRIYIPN